MSTRIFTLTVEVETTDGKNPTIEETTTMLETELDTSLDTDAGGTVDVSVVAVEFVKTKRKTA